MSKEYIKLRSQYSEILGEINKCTQQGNSDRISNLKQQLDEIIKQMQDYLLERNNGEELVTLQVKHLNIPNPASIRSTNIEILSAIDGALDYFENQQIRDDLSNSIREQHLKGNKYGPNNPYGVDSL